MGIKELLAKVTEKKDLRERYAMEKRIAERYEEKKLSANERELLRYQNKWREDAIKRRLQAIRKRENDDYMRSRIGNPANVKNVVRDKKGLFKHRRIFT